MTASAIARTSLLFAVTTLVTSCASGPSLARAVTVEAGEPTRVTLTQTSTSTTFLLQNASSVEAATFYGDRQAQALGKLVDDAQLQALLDVFAEGGLFANAAPAAPAGARNALVVQQGGQRWIWTERQPGFQQGRAWFLEVFNDATAYRAGDPKAPPDLRAENERVRSGSDAARRKLQRAGDRPQ